MMYLLNKQHPNRVFEVTGVDRLFLAPELYMNKDKHTKYEYSREEQEFTFVVKRKEYESCEPQLRVIDRDTPK